MTLEPPQNLVVKFLIELDLFYHPYVFYNISMRRFLIMIFILFATICCGSFPILFFQPASTPTFTLPPPITLTIPSLPISTVIPSLTARATAPAFTPAPSSTYNPATKPFTVLYHPDDILYVGDQVSFEVISPPGLDVNNANVRVQVDPPGGPDLGPVNFSPWGIEGRSEAAMLWSWDTQNLDPGQHTLAFEVESHAYTWTEQVTLLPHSAMPPDEAAAHWSTTQTQCCTVFYITNTASERDLPSLTTMIDEQAQDVIEKMGADFTQPITITVLPRLLGHGGFTSAEISVSYLDRNYASNSWDLVVHHEMIHAIDAHLGGDFRPTIFVEGLAVYMTGGHYKLEPLMPRAATLLPSYLNLYIPLKTLADDFYASQHEIGYLEGASLIEYMVNTYGLDAFLAFYRDIHNHQGESQSDSIDAALQAHFSMSFSQLEQDFLAALRNETDTYAWLDDVRLTVTFYDTMRRYQQLLDPSAYFRTAWLLDNKTMRERGIVADYLRHPHIPVNLALETLFITAHQQMTAQDYTSAGKTLEVISSVLEAIDHATTDPFSVSLLAANYLSIADRLQQWGYDVQSISVSGDFASTSVSTSTGPDLITLTLQLTGGQWSIVP
ncbi:MAG: hypothetical protein A2Z71_11145 [Chloroflexi bacterium RBG_13_50_21]|nr:MAG: hypothetical protein A2Z71_11145 [Chloroflexi bacterium RBG_13_50_21]